MSIRRGSEWGTVIDLPDDVTVVSSDAELAQLCAAGTESQRPIALAGGDLARTMGGGTPGRIHPGATVVRAAVDIVEVTSEGRSSVFVAHLVARRRSWRGSVAFAMNAQFIGQRDVAPRGHPGDGRIEVLQVAPTMPWRARLAARRRAITGTHLPHPDLTVSSVTRTRLSFDRPQRVYLDGVFWTSTTQIDLTVRPSAVEVLV